ADIMESGITLAGGGALLLGITERLHSETGMPINVAANPLQAVAIGSGQSLEEFEALKGVLFSATGH
ncbi:MAG TPA: rod shape-determining protein, partial [Acidimicrobiales bacterium]